jgi:hypothetical protein
MQKTQNQKFIFKLVGGWIRGPLDYWLEWIDVKILELSIRQNIKGTLLSIILL